MIETITMASAILLPLGITKLGALIEFIPDLVDVGVTISIGMIIWIGH